MQDDKSPAVYILASKRDGVLYVGVTSALWNRVATHKDGGVLGFTKKIQCEVSRLVRASPHNGIRYPP